VTDNDEDAIRERLMQLLSTAHAPYSEFRVAAAIVDENDRVHFGVNVENQSLPVGTCAEQGAISALRVAGGKRIKKLYLLSEPNVEALPCGACRQRLSELGDANTRIITFKKNGDSSAFSLGDLFPRSFRFK